MDSNGLERFKKAQENDFEVALSEVKSGQKRSHWIWYIFPQIHGLGFSSVSDYYSIKSLQEAKDYLNDNILRSRLVEISMALLNLNTSDPHKVFGSPDDMKVCSSMTLFETADPTEPVFQKVLDKFYGGKRDQRTIKILKEETR